MGTMPNPDLMDDEDMSDDIPEADTDTDVEDKAAAPDIAPSAPIKRSDLSGYNDGVYRTLSDPLAQSSTYSSLPDALKQHMAKYAQAQEQQKRQALGTGLSAALVQLGHGLSGAKGNADLSGVKAVAQAEGDPMKNLQNEQAEALKAAQMQKILAGSDPNSPLAKAALQAYGPMIQKAGYQLPVGASSDQIQALGRQANSAIRANQIADHQQSMENRYDKRTAAMLAGQNTRSDDKQSKSDEQQGYKLATALDSSGARAGNFGKAGLNVMNAQKIDAILKQFPDGNVPKAQTEELATAAAALIGGGSVQSQAQLNAIVPSSLWGNGQALAGWLSNEPKGLQQQAFIKNLADSAAREKEVAQQQLDQIKAQRLGPYNEYANRNPKKFRQILKSAGMSPDQYDMDSGEYKSGEAPSQAGAQGAAPGSKRKVSAQEIQDYASKHNMNPNAAGMWLRSQGYATD